MSQNLILFAGVTSLFQALLQLMLASLCIAQYFCVADFLRELPCLIFIKIVYFMNPSRCGSTVNIGQALDGIANQAFVLMESEPFTTTRTFIINCTSLGISFIWIVACCILLAGGARKVYPRRVRWPWITATVGVCALDFVATVCYANDTFHTRTLRDIMKYTGGTASGTGGTPIDTLAVSLIMAVVYSRFLIFFILNVILIVLVALNENGEIRDVEAPDTEISLPPEMLAPAQPIAELSQTRARQIRRQTFTIAEGRRTANTILVPEVTESPIVSIPPPVHPLASLVQKDGTSATPRVAAPLAKPIRNVSDEIELESNFSAPVEENYEKLRAWHNLPRVHFNRAYQNMKKRLFNKESPAKSKDNSLVGIAEILMESLRDSTTKRHRKMPNVNNAWSYIPAKAEHHMRDNISSDEELPPIPLPDYSAVPHTYRKASVHRAPSNLATERRARVQYSTRNMPHEIRDVLY